MHIMHVKNEFLYSFFFYYYSWILYMHLINIKALVLNLAEPCCTGFFFFHIALTFEWFSIRQILREPRCINENVMRFNEYNA